MWFRNAIVFRVLSGIDSAAVLEEQLETRPLGPCTGLSTETAGFVEVREEGRLLEHAEGHLMLAMGVEKKVVPRSAIDSAVRDKAKAFEQERGFKPGRKMLREIRDEVMCSLLPRALCKRATTRAWITPGPDRLLVVDTGTASIAERVTELLRAVNPEFKCERTEFGLSPVAGMTDWIARRSAPGNLSIEDECTLVSTDVERASVQFKGHPMDERVLAHLSDGKVATKLALTWADRLSFVLDEQGVVRRIRFHEVEEDREAEAADPEEAFQQDFVFMAAELGALLQGVRGSLSQQPAQQAA